MNYKLAKKLKEAGFPQKGMDKGKYPALYLPKLEELIEACGDRLKMIDTTEDKSADDFTIFQSDESLLGNDKYIIILSDWKYIKKAVANLWLKLNDKGNKN